MPRKNLINDDQRVFAACPWGPGWVRNSSHGLADAPTVQMIPFPNRAEAYQSKGLSLTVRHMIPVE